MTSAFAKQGLQPERSVVARQGREGEGLELAEPGVAAAVNTALEALQALEATALPHSLKE